MFSRRVLVAGLIALIVAIGVRSATSTPATTSMQEDDVHIEAEPFDNVPGPRSVPLESPVSVRPDPSSAVSSPPRQPPVVAEPTPSTTKPELADLVAAGRPPLSDVTVVDDGHVHRHHHAPGEHASWAATTAVVSGWTWRFDDTPDRLREQLASIASNDLIAQLSPTPEQAAERTAAGEVSWAIVRAVTVDSTIATVRFDHHLVTSTTPETVTSRTVTVTIVDGRATEVNL